MSTCFNNPSQEFLKSVSDTDESLHVKSFSRSQEMVDPKEMATHSSVLAWRIPGTGSLVGCRLWGRTELDTTELTWQREMVKRLPTMWETRFNPWAGKILWRRQWQPTPVLLPGKSHGQRIVVGYSPWGRKESDTTERLHFLTSLTAT